MSAATDNKFAKFSDDKIVMEYQRLRGEKLAAKEVYDKVATKLDGRMDQLEMELLRRLNERGQKSFRTDHGTVYREMTIKPSAADWAVIYGWIEEDPERFEILEKRLTKKFVMSYMEEHGVINERTGEKELGEPPPGVNAIREYVARVRKV
jgi:hypothetical protein